MEELINTAITYFKTKFLNGDFEKVSGTQNTIVLKIDGVFDFCFWTGLWGKDYKISLILKNTVWFEFTEEESQQMFDLLDEYVRYQKLAEKHKQLEQLKNELGL